MYCFKNPKLKEGLIKMGKEVGKITKVDDYWMTVQLRSGEQCSVCAAKSACFFAGPESKYRYIKIPFESGYEEGNLISLAYRESSKILSALIVFLLPTLFLLAGYAIGNAISGAGNSGVWGALIGFPISIIVLYLMNRFLSHSRLFLPKVVGKVKKETIPGSGKTSFSH